ncbi:MAG TPA: HipA domain-containing protein [Acidimicrobiales bacterium]|nr:HipA domain-containing protein [Acidimicrobiales bacterium]
MKPRELESLTGVAVADVYKSGVAAGVLRRLVDAVEFSYRSDYLERGSPPVATTLPLTEQPVRTHAGAVPPFFAGLLPEGRRLSSLRRAVKTSADDELSLLLAVGRDAIGDVQVVPEGIEPSPAEPLVQVTRDWSEVRFSDVLEDAGVVDPVALPGIQDKASARMISVPVGRAGERYLLKVDPPEYPHVVENEAFFLALAHRVGVRSASASIVRDATDRPGLLVRRFDRLALPDGTTQPLACEDACQVLGRWPADKYNLTTEQVVVALADCCPARAVALRVLYQQLCYAWLTGNGDVHAKNLSVLATVEGEWRVSPAYDLPSTVPYGDTSLALSLQGRTRGIGRRHLLALAGAIGLPERAAVRVLDGLTERLSGLEEEIRAGALPFPQKVTADLLAELRYRRRQAQIS